MQDRKRLIAVKDAVRDTGLSRATVFRLVKAQGLTRYRIAGVRDTLLSRAELAAALEPHPRESRSARRR